jgi:hypothetical protein
MQRWRSTNLLPCVICLMVSYPNFIFSNFKFQVEIILHTSCSQFNHVVDLIDLTIGCIY